MPGSYCGYAEDHNEVVPQAAAPSEDATPKVDPQPDQPQG